MLMLMITFQELMLMPGPLLSLLSLTQAARVHFNHVL